MMKAANQVWDKNLQILLVLIVGFNLIPHTLDVPPWVTAGAVSALVWKILHLMRGYTLPPRWALLLLPLAATAAIFAEYRTLLGQEAASSLLVLLASCKLLETNRYRDAMLVIFTSYFLLMAHLLNSQSLLSTLFMALDVLLITTLMFQLHKLDRRTSVRSFRPVMKILALALPVWVFLFVSFPRFSAGFWNLQDSTSPATGFSDDLNPGSVEKLATSDEPAFRVSFNGRPNLSPQDLYWRGAILTISDGLKWTKTQENTPGPDLETLVTPDPAARRRVEYEIWLEPIFRKWLFVLDYPRLLDAPERLRFNKISRKSGFVYEATKEISSRIVYAAHSSLEAPRQRLTNEDRARFLQIPAGLPERFHALARDLGADHQSPEEAADRIMTWFQNQGFRYTLSPGTLRSQGADQLPEFLFETKRGFCEHFAAAFATLMRSMGHPARIVIGYQGGKMNEFGSYLIVSSADAHAWTEIWTPEPDKKTEEEIGRWKRIDPTSVIAPMRLQLGGDYNKLDPSLLARGLSGEELRRGLDGGYLRLAHAWDAAQMQWNGFLLRYDFDYQRAILDRIGLKDASRWIFLLWAALGVAAFITVLHISLRRRAKYEDPVLISWRIFCLEMEKAGLPRAPNEGPLAFATRVSNLRPDKGDEIRSITDAFITLRYGPGEQVGGRTSVRRRAFRQSVRRFDSTSH